MSHAPQSSQAAYDSSPYGILDGALNDMSLRGAREGRQSRAVLRAALNGRVLGHTRMRSIVNEGDRFKFYSLWFSLHEEHVLAARRIVSGQGVLAAVEVDTPFGTVRFDCPPGLRAPSRSRAKRQAARPSRKAA